MAKKLLENTDFEEQVAAPVENIVRYGDPGWHDYIMSKLTDDERVDGLPKCDGLRRVFFGEFCVLRSERDLFIRDAEGVVVGWVVEFVPRKEIIVDATLKLPTIRISATAGTSLKNTKHPFSNYLEAVADTRAEARCYKKALLLKGLTAEETQESLEETISEPEHGEMTDAQRKVIVNMCKRIKINLPGTLRHHEKDITDGPLPLVFDSWSGIRDGQKGRLSKNEAAKFMNVLNSYQCTAKEGREVPDSIKEKKE